MQTKYSIRTDEKTAQQINEAYESDRRRLIDLGERPRSLNQFMAAMVVIGIKEKILEELMTK